MSSTVTGQRAQISNIRPHPNASRMDIADVLGHQVVVSRNAYKNGDDVIYFPPDIILPEYMASEHHVEYYTQPVEYTPFHGQNPPAIRAGYRVVPASIHGEMSIGMVIPVPQDVINGERYQDAMTVISDEEWWRGYWSVMGVAKWHGPNS